MSRLTMLDLFAGRGGASKAMRERGWKVFRVEIRHDQRPDIVADVRYLPIKPSARFDFVWASPVCTEFARESMPWCRTGKAPSLDLVIAAKAAIDALNPRWWVIENVRGAVRWLTPILGRPTCRIGSAYLWGRFPLLFPAPVPRPHKERIGPRADRAALWSEIPYEISLAFAVSCERDARLEAA